MNKPGLLILIFVAGLLGSCTSIKQGMKSAIPKDEERNRLSDEVVPHRYDLTLWTDTDKEDFTGQVIIDIEVKEPRQSILLHAQDLNIKSVILKSAARELWGTARKLNQDGLIAIDFNVPISPGDHKLFLDWSGPYDKGLHGLYRVKEGEDYYLFSQFEPISARKMLPSFDEPRFKAPFRVTVIAQKGQSVIANSPLDHQEEQGGRIAHFFADTEPLPTYLLALAVGPFDVVEGKSIKSHHDNKRRIAFRGIATKGKGARLAYAMEKTPKIVEKLEKYFGIAYPFQKLDILAVPDFRAGAMENAGAITFREWLLLMDKHTASVAQKQAFYEVMAHELAHQWFGNRVTMAWWDDLWLNEAFATWLSHKIVDKIKPEFKLYEKLTRRGYDAMVKDGLSTVRKIREPIASSHDIHSAFDGITYLKGGAVLAMWESFIGEKQFQKAVSYHVKRFPYGVATSDDFLSSLSTYSSPDLIKSANSYLNQGGFPVVDLSYNCDETGFTVNVAQKRYVPMGSKALSEGTWDIPLCIGYESTGSVKKHCFMMSKASEQFKIDNARCPAFINPNHKGQGYYRFALSERDWQKLISAPPKVVKGSHGLAIADSLMGELYRGRQDFAFVAEGLRAMLDKDSPHVVNTFVGVMSQAHDFWVNPKERGRLMSYAKSALRPLYDSLQKSDKLSPDAKILKRDLAHFLAHTAHDPEVRTELAKLGQNYYEAYVKGGQPQSAEELLMSDALAVILQDKKEPELKIAIEKLNGQCDATVRGNVLNALSFARAGDDASSLRHLVFDASLRKEEKMPFFYNHLKRPGNQPATWSFVKNNIKALKDNLSPSQLGDLPYLARGLCSEASALEVNEFFAPFIKDCEGGPQNLSEVRELIDICVARQKHNSPLANAFFGATSKEVVSEGRNP